ncbi:STY4851/ECs_5259 family protein [Salinisphaera sp. T31B1]|uniref:STY4851/ECs_5259 family protein n=1 Tax=Salinisphaera sp. T31B1 TaxID=727963 RepID=UPI003341922F
MVDTLSLQYSLWLDKFLQRRFMGQPDQRPLYAYQCNRDEYFELLNLLKRQGAKASYDENRAACAAFVLFCAEWYRRDYQQNFGWSWDQIWQRLGYELLPNARATVVSKGLEGYWKRPLHHYDSGTRNFLGSLFSEGGLPFQVLRQGDNRFQTLFERTLAQYDQARLLGYDTFKHVEQQLERINLPAVFSEAVSVQLIAEMTDQLVALVREYRLTDTNDPVVHLDTNNPRWREQFPLPLDNTTGNRLLNHLLNRATSETKKRKRDDSALWQHLWRPSQPEHLWFKVNLPKQISFRLETQPSTTRFELAIVEGEQSIKAIGPGYAALDDLVARIQLRNPKVIGPRQSSHLPLGLVAMAGGIVIASSQLTGSDVALGEVPLGFEREGDDWQLCGQASLDTASEELLLALPAGSVIEDLEVVEGQPEIIPMPEMLGLVAVMICGKAELKLNADESYRIRTGHGSSGDPGLALAGESVGWATQPALSFIGLPKPSWKNSDPRAQYDTRLLIGGHEPGSVGAEDMLGVRHVTIRNRQGDSLLRRKAGILPTGFRLQLRPGDTAGQGSVLVFSSRRVLLDIQTDTVTTRQIRHDDHTELRLTANSLPPVELRLTVTPSLLADPIEITLPFPGTGCLGFDKKGDKLQSVLSFDDLLGSRLLLFAKPQAATWFVLELTLSGSLARHVYCRWSYQVINKPVEISLYNLREQIIDLMSLSGDIDQTVELRISSPGVGDKIYRIRQHSAELVLDRNRGLLATSGLNKINDAFPEPALMLLHDPHQRARLLVSRTSQGTDVGTYELPATLDRDGPWLVVPSTSDSLSFRPIFLPGNWQAPATTRPSSSLQSAVLNFDPTASASSSPFIPVLNAMAENPLHSGWQFLRALYDQYGYLPLATFEVWKALVHHPRALAMSLFKFEMDPKFLGRIETEFPILWELFPIAHIQQALRAFSVFLAENGVRPEAIDEISNRYLEQLGATLPSYGGNVQAYLGGHLSSSHMNVPYEAFKAVLHSWHQELIRVHSEDQWPEFYCSELKQWQRSQQEAVIDFDTTMSFRNAVVYMPMFAAAVASGDAELGDIFSEDRKSVFFLRQVRDFDSNWFTSVYQYCLLKRLARY